MAMITHVFYILIIILLLLIREKISFKTGLIDLFLLGALVFIAVYLFNYYEITKNIQVTQFFDSLKLILQIILLLIGVIIFLLAIIGFWGKRYTLRVDNFNIGGINVLFDRSNEIFIRAVGGLLETKRSIFKFDKSVDNIYEVFNSYYEIYKYLRDNIELLDSEKDVELYSLTLGMISQLNRFLTLHQNDYRRWYNKVSSDDRVYIYDKNQKNYTEEIIIFHGTTIQKIQEQYYRYDELVKDFETLNRSFSDNRIATAFKLKNHYWEEKIYA